MKFVLIDRWWKHPWYQLSDGDACITTHWNNQSHDAFFTLLTNLYFYWLCRIKLHFQSLVTPLLSNMKHVYKPILISEWKWASKCPSLQHQETTFTSQTQTRHHFNKHQISFRSLKYNCLCEVYFTAFPVQDLGLASCFEGLADFSIQFLWSLWKHIESKWNARPGGKCLIQFSAASMGLRIESCLF